MIVSKTVGTVTKGGNPFASDEMCLLEIQEVKGLIIAPPVKIDCVRFNVARGKTAESHHRIHIP